MLLFEFLAVGAWGVLGADRIVGDLHERAHGQ